jgi:hypothetical protein
MSVTPPSDNPTYILIVAMAILGMISGFIVFTNSQNSNVSTIIAGIITVASLAYGIHVNNTSTQQSATVATAQPTPTTSTPEKSVTNSQQLPTSNS